MPKNGRATDERFAFDNVPDVYDRIRPTYPDALFDELFSHLQSPVRALEIGAGTGKATGSLLPRGAHVTAVEPGANMAAFLRQKHGGDDRLEVLNATFEDAAVEPGYDLVIAATSFHWVDREVRLQKSHHILRAGGALAVISTNQIASNADRGFFEAAQPIYRHHFPGEAPPPPTPGEDVVPDEFADIDASGLFGRARLHRYRWDQTYTTAGWADLVRSFSGTQMMTEQDREALITELSELIDRDFGGSITRPLVITLTLAFRA